MGHGRVSIVLGVQGGLNSIVQLCEEARKLRSQSKFGFASCGHRFSPQHLQVIAQLNQLSHVCKLFFRDGLKVHWSVQGAHTRSELPLLLQILAIPFEEAEYVLVESIANYDCDALVYVPLDLGENKQVEHLARLSMIHPRTRHLAFVGVPKWSHTQLIALRETWEWLDPKQASRVQGFISEIFKANGIQGANVVEEKVSDLMTSSEPGMADPYIITRSLKMKDVLSLVDAVADTDSTILISGESGVGKELIAQRIHVRSHRKNGELVAVNCGAIPSELLETELFGHVKGAFTGAISNRQGRFQAAENGTLFLDEIGEMSPNLQVKLLRVLQSKRYEPVGSTQTKVADARIITATNRDLESEVSEGRFREDLFYRLNVIPVHIPSLRERPEDIELLVEFFVKKFNAEKNRRVTGVTRASMRALVAYEWPGNVRELENLMERMVILKSSGMIDVLDFPEKYRRKTLSEIEYVDLIHGATGLRRQINGTNVIRAIDNGQDTHQGGGEGVMNNNGFFTKGIIEQSSNQGGMSQDTMAQQGSHIEPIAGAGAQVNIDQILRLASDALIFPEEGLDFNAVVDQFENILILHALERTGWNRNRAAGLLRLNRTTLVEKLKKKQLMPPMGAEVELSGNA